MSRIGIWLCIVAAAAAASGCSSATMGVVKFPAMVGTVARVVSKAAPEGTEQPPTRTPPAPRYQHPVASRPAETGHAPLPEKRSQIASSDGTGLPFAAATAYREFEFTEVVRIASQDLSEAARCTDRATLFGLRGAAYYLMDDLASAGRDFRAAKQQGAATLDSNIFPRDMIDFFDQVK